MCAAHAADVQGPSYGDADVFNAETMEPYTLSHLVENFSRISSHIALYLPRSSDLQQISNKAKDDKQTQVVHYCTRGASRALCVYYGSWGEVEA
jgi:trimethylguanosine synthase